MKVLLIDDEKNIRQTLAMALKVWGHDVSSAASVEEGVKALRTGSFDFLLTDYRLGESTGLEVLRQAKTTAHPPVSAVMTAYASFENAVNAIKEGAYDYLSKPFSNSQLEHLIKRVEQLVELKRENEKLKSGTCRSDYFSGQSSAAMLRLEEFVNKVAPTDASILLTGESGTGKTELAKLIHSRSPRAARTFAVVNCTTLAESLIESELFGHVKGAFTGAIHEHVGKLETANHGTLLIDEVGDLSLGGQAKLLRFLQERVLERVGGNRVIPVDARVIAATNRNLEDAVRAGKFREDLYFRLNIFECTLVPLRHRKDDLPILIQRFLREFSVTQGGGVVKAVPEPVMRSLMEYSWPGNVRELRNTIERFMLLSQGREFELHDLPGGILRNAWQKGPNDKGEPGVLRSLEEVEREHIEKVLSLEPNQERAAEILGITTVTLWRKRKQYGLP